MKGAHRLGSVQDRLAVERVQRGFGGSEVFSRHAKTVPGGPLVKPLGVLAHRRFAALSHIGEDSAGDIKRVRRQRWPDE